MTATFPGFLAKLGTYGGDVHAVQALRLLMLTATRPGELRGARWAEFDLDAAVWIIPAERMKMRSEHPGCRCRRRRWTCCALWSR